ncbi:type IV pilus modification protein PilV [Dyella jiangningensis]|nr:type IV pilus modification protein PilV [Dyella jiangningensis]
MSSIGTSAPMSAFERNEGIKSRLSSTRARQAGVGLIEVMIAVLVLSIAFLGMAALQARSLSTNNSSMARTMATIAAHSIQDAMRADIVNATGGVYNRTITADKCPATDGTLAGYQLNQWCTTQLAIPALGGAVSTTSGVIDCKSSGLCTITVSFDDTKAGAINNNTSQSVITKGIL